MQHPLGSDATASSFTKQSKHMVVIAMKVMLFVKAMTKITGVLASLAKPIIMQKARMPKHLGQNKRRHFAELFARGAGGVV